MSETIATVALFAAALYLAAGFVFALWFSFRGVYEFDLEARHSPLMFRLLIIPASALLWIFLLKKIREKKL